MPYPRCNLVFDFGGVLITPITTKIGALASHHGVSMETLLVVLMGPRDRSTSDHPWHRAERGHLPVAEIQGLLGPYAEAASVQLNGNEIEALMEPTYKVHEPMVERIARLHQDGYRTALLTNSFREFRPTIERDVDVSLFDLVIDSSEVGCRKPEPEIYRLTTARLGSSPEEILYLDDFADNLYAARSAGWKTIHVVDQDEAIAELDRMLA